jgi:hypothetical protein
MSDNPTARKRAIAITIVSNARIFTDALDAMRQAQEELDAAGYTFVDDDFGGEYLQHLTAALMDDMVSVVRAEVDGLDIDTGNGVTIRKALPPRNVAAG